MQGDIKMSKLAACGGCGAKVGAGMLSQILQGIPTVKDENLLVGYDTSDDAAVYKVSDDLAIVQTLDFFPPIVDDPYMFGQIAAANAISDIYAMGATPKIALNIMTVTPQMSKEMIHEVLRGGYEKAYEAGVIIAGGHTINDQEPKYGLSVTGFARPDEIRMNCTPLEGDVLILTKPLGIGITTTANRAELAPPELYQRAVKQMATLWPKWASSRRAPTATVSLPGLPPASPKASRCICRISCTIRRPPAACSSPWMRAMPKSCWQSSCSAKMYRALPSSAAWSSTRIVPSM